MSIFEQVTPTVRYARAATCIGVITHGDRALLVDTGLDENLARKVVNALEKEGVSVCGIVNTHSHADHCGGNAFVQKRCDVTTAAPADEHVFIERPMFEPWSLFGAPAPTALTGKFLQAAPSRVDTIIEAADTRIIAGFDVRLHDLAGHSVRQMGVEVDRVLFVGDALLPASLVEKYGVLFAVDPLAARASAARIVAGAPGHVVAYHGGLLDDIPGAAQSMVESIDAVETILRRELARRPCTAEDLLVAVLDARPPAHSTVELHALLAATIRGHLASLERAGVLSTHVEAHRLMWTLK